MEQLATIFPKIRGTYLVGGSIRDHLLGKVPVDYDLAVTENPLEFGRRIASKRSTFFSSGVTSRSSARYFVLGWARLKSGATSRTAVNLRREGTAILKRRSTMPLRQRHTTVERDQNWAGGSRHHRPML